MTPEMQLGAAVDEALAITRHMLECAQDGAWESVAALEDQRRHAINRWGAAPASRASDDPLGIALSEIRDLNEEILFLAEAHRLEALTELRKIHQGRRAVPAYEGSR